MLEQVTETKGLTATASEPNLARRRAGTGSHALILKAAQALPPADRALLQSVYADGRSAAEVARLRNVPERRISYHVRRLTRLVLSPEYAFVLEHRRRWSRNRARIATDCFIRGRSIREAARLSRISYHAALQHYHAVLALMQAHESPPLRIDTPTPQTARDILGGAA